MTSAAPSATNSFTAAKIESILAKPTGVGVGTASEGIQRSTVAGANVIEFAADDQGTIQAGILLAQLCLGWGGDIEILPPPNGHIDRPHVHVSVGNPLWSCIGCQYAGWPLSVGKFFAMASGPARLLRGKEYVLEEYHLTQNDSSAVVILETASVPTPEIIQTIVQETGVDPHKLYVCTARTASVPGSLQVVARSIETAIHKLHEIEFDLTTIVSGTGSAPLPPETDDDLVALGWTNDAMLFGADVQLVVDTTDQAIESIIETAPSNSSEEFGTPFLELFKKHDYDFYKVDKRLFSPAKITLHNQRTGNQFSAGEVRNDILALSYGM